MTPFVLRISLGLMTVVQLGCQAFPGEILNNSVPIYATSADVKAVAGGQFGAVPIEISSESELELVSTSCSSVAAQIRSRRTGKLGWVPASALPATCAGRAAAKEQPATGFGVN